MGFRNPFRIQVDENDVAYVTDYSPDSQRPAARPRPGGRRPLRDRAQAVQLRLSALLLEQARLLQVELPRVRRPGHHHRPAPRCTTRRADRLRRRDGQLNDSRWVREGGPGFEPGLRELPPVTDPDIWYSYRDNNATTPLGTPCPGYYATTPGPIAPGLDHRVPAPVPGALHGRRRPRTAPPSTTTTRPTRTPKKFPPYYDDSVILGEFGQDTMREIKLDGDNRVFKINPFLDCGRRSAPTRVRRSSATTRWTCSSAPTAPSTC